MNTRDRIVSLSKKLVEVYQDIEIDGEVVVKGKRECVGRLGVVERYIKPHDVVMDLGSSVGCFAHRIAQKYPASLVVSFESDKDMCEIQKQVFEHEGIYNVVVCQHRLSQKDLAKWVNYVDCFDKILALSVLHHYAEIEIESVYTNLRLLGGQIIGEVPAKYEEEACGGEAKEVARKIERENRVVAEFTSHLGNYQRKTWITPPDKIDRLGLSAFFGVNHEDRHRFALQWDNGQWRLNGKLIVPGINVWNLLHFNIVWPPVKWWQVQALAAYGGIREKSDVRPWNLLVTSVGLKAIDFRTKFIQGDPAAFRESDLDKLREIFGRMKAVDLWTPENV